MLLHTRKFLISFSDIKRFLNNEIYYFLKIYASLPHIYFYNNNYTDCMEMYLFIIFSYCFIFLKLQLKLLVFYTTAHKTRLKFTLFN